jgi:hypothetical protein
MSALWLDGDDERVARAINRRDDRARLAQQSAQRAPAAEWDLTITRPPPQAGCIGYEPEVTLPRIDWQAVAIAAVTLGVLCGVWIGVAWLVWRQVTR